MDILNKHFIRFSKHTKGVFLSWVSFMILFLLNLLTENTSYSVLVKYAYYFSIVVLGYYILVLRNNFKRFEKEIE